MAACLLSFGFMSSAFEDHVSRRLAVQSRCKDMEPLLLRLHTVALQNSLLDAATQHALEDEQRIADRNMAELLAADQPAAEMATP